MTPALHAQCTAVDNITPGRDRAKVQLWLQLIMEEQRFATVMWGGFDFIADAGGADPSRQEWLMECTGLQVSLFLCHMLQCCSVSLCYSPLSFPDQSPQSTALRCNVPARTCLQPATGHGRANVSIGTAAIAHS